MLGIFFSVLYVLLVIGVVILIIGDKSDAGRKFAWLLIITVLPAIGLVLYFMFGINYRHHWFFDKLHQKYKDAFTAGTTHELNTLLFGHRKEAMVREEYRPLARMMGHGVYPTVSDANDIEVITSGERKFELLSEDILNAKESIHIEYFHFGNDASSMMIRNLLIKKAQEGVKVRFLYENIANFPISSRYYNDMKKNGVEVVKFTNPRSHLIGLVTSLNFRNHRKIVVIDGAIGYTGGMNINDHYYNMWRDTHLRLTGNAVAALQYTFLDSWLTAKGTIDRNMIEYYPMAIPSGNGEIPVLPAAPQLPTSLDMDKVHPVLRGKLMQVVPDEPDSPVSMLQYSYEWAIQHARKYIYLQTPYFVPPEPVLNALRIAALSGVDVRLMLPERADNLLMRPANKAFYEDVLASGVRLYLYKDVFIHSKTFICDDYLTSVGSANIDFRSFCINYEVNAYIYDEETALMNKRIFLKDMENCVELTKQEWSRRPWYNKVIESIARLFAPLL